MENNLMLIVMLLTGIAIGAAAVWWSFRTRVAHSYEIGRSEGAAALAAYQERLAAREQELQN